MLGHHRHASLGNLPSRRLAPLLGATTFNNDVEGFSFATASTKRSAKRGKLSLHFKVASDCWAYTKTQSTYTRPSKIQGDALASDDSDIDSVPDLSSSPTSSPTSSDNISLPDFDDFKGAIDCPEVTSEGEDTRIAYGALVGLGSRQAPKRRVAFTLGDDEDVEEKEESTSEGECEDEVLPAGVGLRRQMVGKEASLNLSKWFARGGM